MQEFTWCTWYTKVSASHNRLSRRVLSVFFYENANLHRRSRFTDRSGFSFYLEARQFSNCNQRSRPFLLSKYASTSSAMHISLATPFPGSVNGRWNGMGCSKEKQQFRKEGWRRMTLQQRKSDASLLITRDEPRGRCCLASYPETFAASFVVFGLSAFSQDCLS